MPYVPLSAAAWLRWWVAVVAADAVDDAPPDVAPDLKTAETTKRRVHGGGRVRGHDATHERSPASAKKVRWKAKARSQRHAPALRQTSSARRSLRPRWTMALLHTDSERQRGKGERCLSRWVHDHSPQEMPLAGLDPHLYQQLPPRRLSPMADPSAEKAQRVAICAKQTGCVVSHRYPVSPLHATPHTPPPPQQQQPCERRKCHPRCLRDEAVVCAALCKGKKRKKAMTHLLLDLATSMRGKRQPPALHAEQQGHVTRHPLWRWQHSVRTAILRFHSSAPMKTKRSTAVTGKWQRVRRQARMSAEQKTVAAVAVAVAAAEVMTRGAGVVLAWHGQLPPLVALQWASSSQPCGESPLFSPSHYLLSRVHCGYGRER